MGKMSAYTVELGECTFRKIVAQPGARWSTDAKPIVGGDTCQQGHVGVMLRGTLVVQMEDGKTTRMQAGDVGLTPPRHDSWVDGDEPVEWIEFSYGWSLYDK